MSAVPTPAAPPLLDVNLLQPYLSGSFLKSDAAGLEGQALADAVMAEVKTEVTALLKTRPARQVIEEAATSAFDGVFVAAIVYRETSIPTWAPVSKLEDVAHHSVFVVCRDHWCFLVTSDSTFRRSLLAAITVAQPLSRKSFSTAFVGPAARAMWLDGVHSHSKFKADGKVLIGTALENAVDPLGDHTFAMSAIRSQPGIKKMLDAVVGASLSTRSLWIGRSASWDAFVDQVDALFDHLDKPPKSTSLYKSLAEPIDDLSVLSKAYEVAILPSILLGDEGATTPAELASAQYWANSARYKVKAGTGADFDVEVEAGGASLGTFHATVSRNAHQRIKISGKWSSTPSGVASQRKECKRFLTDSNQIKIYYDSDHTISFGECFQSGWTDQIFNWRFEDFTGFEVENEKPAVPTGGKLADCIGTATDKSLFGFVQKKLFAKGWLACDDGAMELADFVHFDPVSSLITLIHVKGSGNSDPAREISVADYEIVVSQGVKNIRHLRMSNLIDKLEADKSKDIARAVWHDGVKQPDRTGLIAELKKWTDSAPRRLMILQPRLTEAEKNYCSGKKPKKQRLLRFKQLNALVLTGRYAAMSAGADFEVVVAE